MMSPNEYWHYVASLSVVEVGNAALALGAAVASLRAIFSMDAKTNRALRCGFVTLATGLFGQGISILIPNTWTLGYDALMFGGSLALFLSNRRHLTLVPEGQSQFLSLSATAMSWALFFATI